MKMLETLERVVFLCEANLENQISKMSGVIKFPLKTVEKRSQHSIRDASFKIGKFLTAQREMM